MGNGSSVAHRVAEAKTGGQLPSRTSEGGGCRGMAMTAAEMRGVTVPRPRPTTPVIVLAIDLDRPLSCMAVA